MLSPKKCLKQVAGKLSTSCMDYGDTTIKLTHWILFAVG